MQGKGVLITGGAGFIGSQVAQMLPEALTADRHMKLGVDLYLDVTDRAAVLHTFQEVLPHTVIHLAGMLGTHELVDNSYEASRVNILGTLNILDACLATRARLVFVSKPNVWLNTYSITKDTCERFIQMYRGTHGLQAVVLKPFNVYGPGQPIEDEAGYRKAVPTWLTQPQIEIYGDGSQTMDLVHVRDTARAFALAVERFSDADGLSIEIGSGVETSVTDLANQISRYTTAPVVHLPMRKGEVPQTHLAADITLAKQHLGWAPAVPLDLGLLETIRWYEFHYQKTSVEAIS